MSSWLGVVSTIASEIESLVLTGGDGCNLPILTA